MPPQTWRARPERRDSSSCLRHTPRVARQSGQDDLCIGVPVAGRQRVELEPLPGLFANNLPVRIRLAAGDTFRALVARLHETVVTASSTRISRSMDWS